MALQQLGRTTLGTAIAYKIAKGGHKRGSLIRDGAVAAFTVAALAFSCSFRSGITLLCFYKTGSMLTKYGAAVKQKLEEDYVAGEGQRGAGQVLACSAIAVACAIMRRLLVGTDGPLSLGVGELECLGNRLTLAFVAFSAAVRATPTPQNLEFYQSRHLVWSQSCGKWPSLGRTAVSLRWVPQRRLAVACSWASATASSCFPRRCARSRRWRT